MTGAERLQRLLDEAMLGTRDLDLARKAARWEALASDLTYEPGPDKLVAACDALLEAAVLARALLPYGATAPDPAPELPDFETTDGFDV